MLNIINNNNRLLTFVSQRLHYVFITKQPRLYCLLPLPIECNPTGQNALLKHEGHGNGPALVCMWIVCCSTD